MFLVRTFLDRNDLSKHKSALQDDSQTRILCIDGEGKISFLQDANHRLNWMSPSQTRLNITCGVPLIEDGWQNPNFTMIYLGYSSDDGINYYALSLLLPRTGFLPGRHPSVFSLTKPGESAILAQALSLSDWHRRYKFCSNCGQATKATEAGYKRVCSNISSNASKSGGIPCNEASSNFNFPRTDPVVITLILDRSERYALLGRSSRHPPGTYSCIAGFMEPGEGISDACKRESLEETGITLSKTQLVLDQPWPYPCSLMLGCFSWTDFDVTENSTTSKPVLRDGELEDAKWFSLNDITDAFNGKNDILTLPPAYTIANRLIKAFLHNVKGKTKTNTNKE